MTTGQWLLLSLAVALMLYAAFVAGLVVAGRRSDAAAVARFIPDCIVLFRRLVADPRVPRARKLLLVALIAYLAMPFDLVPDFIPVAGQLDDAILVALVLRSLLRSTDPALAAEHWPGPEASLAVILRLAGGNPRPGQRRCRHRASRLMNDAVTDAVKKEMNARHLLNRVQKPANWELRRRAL